MKNLKEMIASIDEFTNYTISRYLPGTCTPEEQEIKEFLVTLDAREFFYLTRSHHKAELIEKPMKVIVNQIVAQMHEFPLEEGRIMKTVENSPSSKLKAFFAENKALSEEEMKLLSEELNAVHPLNSFAPDFGTETQVEEYINGRLLRECITKKQVFAKAMQIEPLVKLLTASMPKENEVTQTNDGPKLAQ